MPLKQKPFDPVPQDQYDYQLMIHLENLKDHRGFFDAATKQLASFNQDIAGFELAIKKLNATIAATEGSQPHNINNLKYLEKEIEMRNHDVLIKERTIMQIEARLLNAAKGFVAHYPHINLDYQGNYISYESFIGYLKMYQEGLPYCNDITLLQKQCQEIQLGIDKYLKE